MVNLIRIKDLRNAATEYELGKFVPSNRDG